MYRAEQKNSKTSTVIYWLFTTGYMGFIFYLSSRNWPMLSDLPQNFDKGLHAITYIPLSFLISIALSKSGIKRYVFILAFLISTLYGVSDELHQSFVPGRDASIYDLLADTIGAFLGSYFANKITS